MISANDNPLVDHPLATAAEIHNVEQGSLDWHLLRSRFFTASEMAALAGESKWFPKTARDVLRVKYGEKVVGDNPMMAHGRRMEPVARDLVNAELSLNAQPVVVSRGPVLASLDGWDADSRTVVEIKCPATRTEFSTEVPSHYLGQLAAQWYCTNAARVLFVEYIQGAVQVIDVPVATLQELWVTRYAPVVFEHLQYLYNGGLPGTGERTDEEWRAAAARYIHLKQIADQAQIQADEARGALAELAGEDDAEGAGIKLAWINRAGNVNWKAKPIVEALAAAGIDVEKFRGKPIRSMRIDVIEDKQ